MKIRTVEAKLPDWIFTCAPKSAVNIHDLCKIFKVTDHTINTWINLGLFPPQQRISIEGSCFFNSLIRLEPCKSPDASPAIM